MYGDGEANGAGEVYGNEKAYGEGNIYGDGQADGGGWASDAPVLDADGHEKADGEGNIYGDGQADGGGWASDAPVLDASLAKIVSLKPHVCICSELGSASISISDTLLKEGAAPEGFNDDEHALIERSLSAAVPGHHYFMGCGVCNINVYSSGRFCLA